MRTHHTVVAVLAAGLALVSLPTHAGDLKDIGKATAYPFKKGAHNAGKTIKTGAGRASKGLNHAGQAMQYPVCKTGENASKTSHKTVKGVKK